MVLETIALIANSLVGAIYPGGYAYTQYPNNSQINVVGNCNGDIGSGITESNGYYGITIGNTPNESEVKFNFTYNSLFANIIDTIGDNWEVPEVFLYNPEQRHITASVYRLINNSGVDSSLVKAILTNQKTSQSDSGIVYPTDALSKVLAHIRADTGDSLLLKIFAPRDDTSQFVSYRTFVAPDSGNDAVFVRNDSTGIQQSRRNYGFIDFPDSIEVLPRLNLKIVQILEPTSGGLYIRGDTITPTAVWKNVGNISTPSAKGFMFLYREGDSLPVYQDSATIMGLSVGQADTVEFVPWVAGDTGNYQGFSVVLPEKHLGDDILGSESRSGRMWLKVKRTVREENPKGGWNIKQVDMWVPESELRRRPKGSK